MTAAALRREWSGKGARRLATMGPHPQALPVASPYAWYDPSAGTAGVVMNTGVQVSGIGDLSGNARDATAFVGVMALGAPRGLFNGRPAFYFESTACHAAFGGVTAADRTFSLFSVVMPATFTSRNPCIFGPNADGGLEIRINSAAADGKITVLSADTAELAKNDANPLTLGVPAVVGVVLTATDITIYNNLNSETDANATTFTAGRTGVLGRASSVAGDTDRFWGWIGETVMWDSSLSSGDATSVIGYLMSKWGIVS